MLPAKQTVVCSVVRNDSKTIYLKFFPAPTPDVGCISVPSCLVVGVFRRFQALMHGKATVTLCCGIQQVQAGALQA